MKTIRWGIVGAGDVTEKKSGPGFQKAENSELVAVMRRNGELAKDYAERHNVSRWYDDAEKLINDSEVDAVYIATPPHVHMEYTKMCAAAGKPVFVEKPMALTHAECETMIDVCEKANVPLWLAYYRRCLPRFVKLKELIDSGALGEIRTVIVHLSYQPIQLEDGKLPWRVQPEISGGGLFLDLGVHMLDILDYLVGPIVGVDGYASNQAGLYKAEDNVIANFVFANGATGIGTWGFAAGTPTDHTIIVGSKGEVEYTTFKDKPMTLITKMSTRTMAIKDPEHVHQPLIQSIVNELNGEGKCPSTGISGARTQQVVDAILEEYRAETYAAD